MKNYQRTSKFFGAIVFLALFSFTTSSCLLLLPFDKMRQSQEESEIESKIIVSRSSDENSSNPIISETISEDITSNPDVSESQSQDSSHSDSSETSFEYSEDSETPVNTGYEKGVLTSNSLKSRYLNISFIAPSGYLMLNEEEIDNLVTFVGETMYKDEDKKIIDYSRAQTVFEMIVQDPTGLPNMSIIVEKIQSGIDYTQYINALKQQVVSVDGMDYTFSVNAIDVSLAGNTYKKLSSQLVYMNVEMNQDFYMRIKDDRMIGITLTYSEETKSAANNLINAIKAYQ